LDMMELDAAKAAPADPLLGEDTRR